jgi:hypothetical protein
MKPSSWDKQLGLALPLERAAGQSNQTTNPSKNDVGLDVSHHTCVFPRGRGEAFFLDILFHRMSDIAMLRQQQKSSSISGHVYGDNCENDSGGQRHRSDE